MKFNLRDIVWLTAILALAVTLLVGYRNSTQHIRDAEETAALQQKAFENEHRVLREKVEEYKQENVALKAQLNLLGLYADVDAERLIKAHTVDSIDGKDFLVVPFGDGRAWPRRRVFEILKIDESRLVDFRHSGANHIEVLAWQFSPHYDLVCTTATNGRQGPNVRLDHPNREVYGVHFYKRIGNHRFLTTKRSSP